MYYKRSTGAVLVRKSAEIPDWIQWAHHSEGKTHCDECMALNGCLFLKSKAPKWPHHPYCHCTLDPIDYSIVLNNASAYANYSKFNPYLFDPENYYKHGKNKIFESWGYTIADSQWLKEEIETQAHRKYVLGEYTLGVLNLYGQRISIRIEIPRKDGAGMVSFITGWTVRPSGQLTLNTPLGGK